MTKSMHDEKWVKRWLKRTVSITLGVVVGVLINGGVVFAQDTASLEATVRAQQEQINALIKEVNALKNELSTREQVAPKKVRSVEVTSMGAPAAVTGGENTPVALSGVDTITGVGPVTVSTNDRNANISLKNEFTYGNIGMNFNAGEIKTKKLIVDGKSITEQFNELVLPIGINGTGANVKLNGGRLSFNAGDGIGIYGDGEGGMTIASTFKPATRLQIGIDSTGADVDLINGRLHFISENGITMHGNGAGNVNIGLADNIELGKLKLQGPNGIIHLGNDTILESSHFKVGKMDFNGKEDGTGINMYGLPLTGLKDAAVDGDAVNYGQFKIVQEKVKSNETGLNSIKNFDYSGDSGTGTLILGSESSRFNVHGDGSNISTVASDKGVEVNLNQKLAIGGITVDGTNNQILIGQDKICLSTNETKLNGVTIGEKEINAGGKKIGGLAPGTNEGDAISYSQYYGPIRMTITNESKGESSSKNINIHNSGYNYIFSNGLNGEWCDANTIKIGLGNKVEIKNDSSKGTGNIILEAVGNNSSIKLQDLKISNTGITVPNNSTVKIGDITIDGHSMNFGTQKLTITPDSINVGGGKITNIGAGKVAGDAVNYGQLTGVANKVKSLEESLNASGQLKYTGETGAGEINLRNKTLSLKGDEAITTVASDNGVIVSLKNKFTKGKLSVNSDLGTVQLGGKLPGESKLELSPDSIKAGALEWKDNELKLGNISMKNNNMSIGETKIESNSIQFNEGQIKGLKSPVQKDEAVNLGYLQEKEAAIKGELEKPFILVDSTGKNMS